MGMKAYIELISEEVYGLGWYARRAVSAHTNIRETMKEDFDGSTTAAHTTATGVNLME